MRWLFPFALWPCLLLAQQGSSYSFLLRKFDEADGLLHRRVTSMVQDREGFLWLATPVGIQRFDGHRFTSYPRAEGSHGEEPLALWSHSDGTIWVVYGSSSSAMVKGIDVLDPRTGVIETFAEHFGGRAPMAPERLCIWARRTRDGSLVIGAKGHLVRFHGERGFSVVRLQDDQCFFPVIAGTKDEVIGIQSSGPHTPGALLTLTSAGAVLDTLLAGVGIDPSPMGFSGADQWLDSLGAEEGCYLRVNEKDGRSAREVWLSADGSIRSLGALPLLGKEELGERRVPVGAGIWLVNGALRRLTAGDDPGQAPLLFDLETQHPELGFRIHSTFVDRLGHIWSCTEFGLFQLTVRPSPFQRMLWQGSIPGGFGMRVRGMALSGDRLHVNTEGEGYWVVDRRNGQVLRADTSGVPRYGMATDGLGGLWRCEGDGLIHEDSSGRRTGLVGETPMGAWSILPFASSLLLGTPHGLLLIDPRTGHGSAVNDDHLNKADRNGTLGQSTVIHLARDSEGTTWACASTGLFKLDAEGHPVERFSNAGDSSHFLPALDFRHFTERAGVMWFATGDGGILRWDRGRRTVKSVTRRNGLPSNTVHAVYFDEAGRLWAPTDNGLVRYDTETEQISVFTTADGIAHNEFNRLAHARGTDGRFYFGGLNGITVFHPNDPRRRQQRVHPPLVVSAVNAFVAEAGRVVDLYQGARAGDTMEVSNRDRSLNIGFALLSYEDPRSILYGWRLEGTDNDWHYQHEPELHFTSLPAGEHVLRIKAQGGDGQWGPEELRLTLIVDRPFYQRWWFVGLGGAGVMTLLFAALRRRSVRIPEP